MSAQIHISQEFPYTGLQPKSARAANQLTADRYVFARSKRYGWSPARDIFVGDRVVGEYVNGVIRRGMLILFDNLAQLVASDDESNDGAIADPSTGRINPFAVKQVAVERNAYECALEVVGAYSDVGFIIFNKLTGMAEEMAEKIFLTVLPVSAAGMSLPQLRDYLTNESPFFISAMPNVKAAGAGGAELSVSEVAEEIRRQMLGATIQVLSTIAKEDASSRQEVELARGGKPGKPTFDELDERNALLLERPLPTTGIQAPIQAQADPNVAAILQRMERRDAREHAEVDEMKAEMAELRSMLEAATAPKPRTKAE